MKIRSLALRNFKAFHGEHRLDLPDGGPDRPVYLVGGLNGAGKTSLPQAVVLCLHGERAADLPGLFRGGRDQGKRYRGWLQAAFNRRARFGGEDQMQARVELDAATGRVSVTRSWWFDVSGPLDEEALEVRITTPEGGTELLIGAEAQQAIDELFPRHLLDFAVFDGEQVRRLDDTLSASAVQAALDRLLELEPVDRARRDVLRAAEETRLRHADHGQQSAHALLRRQRDDLAEQRVQAQAELAAAARESRRLQTEADAVAATLREHLSRTAGTSSAAIDAGRLRARRTELATRIGRAVADWGFVLPAAGVLPGLVADVERLRSGHRDRERAKLDLETVESLADAARADDTLRALLGDAGSREVDRWLEAAARDRRTSLDAATGAAAADPLDVLTDAELAEVEAAARTAVQRDMTDVASLASELGRIDLQLDALADVPGSDSQPAEQLLRRRDELSIELGRSQARHEQLRDRLDEIDAQLASLRAQIARFEQRLAVDPSESAWLAAADRTAAALEDFLDTRRARAVAHVETAMLAGLRLLLRKTDLVHDVQIDPADLTTRLVGPDGEDVELPSAAEHQLAAMAFIEAVLSAAATPLPVFIDTPLARLDSHHRRAVVGRFWPSLGRQVIVLSTDEEVTGPLLSLAGPHVAQTYVVEVAAGGDSTITAGSYLQELT